MQRLPIDDILPALRDAIVQHGRAVLQAPPGAGKTTRVPPALLDLVDGRIVMLEPRRLAARAAAARMADEMGEKPGETVGYRMRGEAAIGKATRIEVVTEAILTRMIQDDPALTGIGAVIFDEFHERSLHADLGLALAWESRTALRPDLALVVMSATLDAAPVAALMEGAPVLTAEGRAYPVETIWLDKPLPPRLRFEQAVADLVLRALGEAEGSALVFLPGEGEIRRVAALLEGALPEGCVLRPLYGAMDIAAQRAAIAPGRGRKVVLATAIAETSLTIEGVRIVVDGGRARRSRFDPGSGMARLVTERVTRAEAEQRRGRAGRVEPGICYRLWTRGEEGALADQPPPEIAAGDLAGLALDLAAWGAPDGAGLAFLTPPPEAALAEAQALLAGLGALEGGRITDHGRRMAALPVHPRLAHMLLEAGPQAAGLAALLAGRDPLPRSAGADLAARLALLRGRGGEPSVIRLREEAARLRRAVPGDAPGEALSPGAMASLAYPDRIALRRPGDAPRYLLSGGKGAFLDPDDALAGQRMLVACDLDGDATEARIRLAAPVTEAEIRALHGGAIAWRDVCRWSRRERRVVARRQECLGALVLEDRVWKDVPREAVARAALDGLRELGLPWREAAALFRARVERARAGGVDLPAMDDATLLAGLEEWLLPHLGAPRSAADLRALDLLPALRAMLDWPQMQALDAACPARFVTPLGREVPVDYEGEVPGITVRLQEMFGLTTHPLVAGQPLRITLTSPAGRPIQVTTDLPGFWASSYADVRKDMRGRYPKHPWPEDPAAADPTLRAKPRR